MASVPRSRHRRAPDGEKSPRSAYLALLVSAALLFFPVCLVLSEEQIVGPESSVNVVADYNSQLRSWETSGFLTYYAPVTRSDEVIFLTAQLSLAVLPNSNRYFAYSTIPQSSAKYLMVNAWMSSAVRRPAPATLAPPANLSRSVPTAAPTPVPTTRPSTEAAPTTTSIPVTTAVPTTAPAVHEQTQVPVTTAVPTTAPALHEESGSKEPPAQTNPSPTTSSTTVSPSSGSLSHDPSEVPSSSNYSNSSEPSYQDSNSSASSSSSSQDGASRFDTSSSSSSGSSAGSYGKMLNSSSSSSSSSFGFSFQDVNSSSTSASSSSSSSTAFSSSSSSSSSFDPKDANSSSNSASSSSSSSFASSSSSTSSSSSSFAFEDFNSSSSSASTSSSSTSSSASGVETTFNSSNNESSSFNLYVTSEETDAGTPWEGGTDWDNPYALDNDDQLMLGIDDSDANFTMPAEVNGTIDNNATTSADRNDTMNNNATSGGEDNSTFTYGDTGVISTSNSTEPIYFRGGAVLTAPITVYLIWYGGWSNNPNDITKILAETFVSNVGSSSWWKVTTTYMDMFGYPASSKFIFGGSYYDPYSSGTVLMNTSTAVVGIINRAAATYNLSRNENTMYLVIGSADIQESYSTKYSSCSFYCGYHWYFTTNTGARVPYGYLFDPSACPYACYSSPILATGQGPNGNAAADSMIKTLGHEMVEIVTDPFLDGWYDNSRNEASDKCSTVWGNVLTAPNGAPYNVIVGNRRYILPATWALDRQACELTRSPPTPAPTPAPTPVPTPAPTPAPTPFQCSTIQENTDLWGSNLNSVPGPTATSCCSICAQTANCTGYSWNTYQGGTCWLKGGGLVRAASQGTYSASLTTSTSVSVSGAVSSVIDDNLDRPGNDLRAAQRSTAEACPGVCQSTPGCTHYSWSSFNAGTCWMKTSSPASTQYAPGTRSAVMIPYTCNMKSNTDAVGGDLGAVQRPSPNDCCIVCKQTQGCGGFAWSEYQGGTCWLKTSATQTSYALNIWQGVVS